MASEKKTGVKPVETEDSNKDQTTIPIVVDQIETVAEMVLKDQEMARKIISRVVPVESELKQEQQVLNRKKAFVGCWLLLSKRLANSGDEEDKTKETDKASSFDQMLAEQNLSRATAYRRMSFARACIEKGVITTETLALIEKSAVTTPELISLLDASLSTPKGMKIQQDQGLLPSPDKPKTDKKRKSLKEQLNEKSKQVETLLSEIKKLLTDTELTKGISDPGVVSSLTSEYANLDSTFWRFKSIAIPDLRSLQDFTLPEV